MASFIFSIIYRRFGFAWGIRRKILPSMMIFPSGQRVLGTFGRIAAQWFNINPLSHKCALLNAPYFVDHIKFQQINFSLNLVKLVQNFIYKSMIPSRNVYKILQQLD